MNGKIKFAFGEMCSPPQDSSLLYHYCSLDSFYNIIKTGKVRLGNLLMMNDPSEIFLRKICLPKYIYDLYKKDPFDFQFVWNDFTNDMESYLEYSYMHSVISGNEQFSNLFHALCLSTKENDLSQWRLYGDNGKGVCIGFKREAIEAYVKNNNAFSIKEIKYFDDPNVLIRDIASEILKQIKAFYEADDKEKLSEYRFNYISDFVAQWANYKVSDYKDESEVRLVHTIKTNCIIPNANAVDVAKNEFMNDLIISVSENEIKTYLEVPIRSIGITSVTFGPCNDKNNKMGVNLLLAKYGVDIKSEKIYKSFIPYRG